MNTPESYYVGALKRALEGDLEGALAFQEKAEESREAYGYSFSEAVSENFPFIEEAVTTLLSSYDFTRCVRPNGTAYGTRGKCKKGSEQEKQEPKLSPGAKVLSSLLKWGMANERDSLTKEEQRAVDNATPKQMAETLNQISKDKTFWKDLSVSVVKGFAAGFMRGLD